MDIPFSPQARRGGTTRTARVTDTPASSLLARARQASSAAAAARHPSSGSVGAGGTGGGGGNGAASDDANANVRPHAMLSQSLLELDANAQVKSATVRVTPHKFALLRLTVYLVRLETIDAQTRARLAQLLVRFIALAEPREPTFAQLCRVLDELDETRTLSRALESDLRAMANVDGVIDQTQCVAEIYDVRHESEFAHYLSEDSALGAYLRRVRLSFETLRFDAIVRLVDHLIAYVGAAAASQNDEHADAYSRRRPMEVSAFLLHEGRALLDGNTHASGLSERLAAVIDNVPSLHQAHLLELVAAAQRRDTSGAVASLHRFHDYDMFFARGMLPRAVTTLGWIYLEQGHFERARLVLTEALGVAEEHKDHQALAQTLSLLAHLSNLERDSALDEELFVRSLDNARQHHAQTLAFVESLNLATHSSTHASTLVRWPGSLLESVESATRAWSSSRFQKSILTFANETKAHVHRSYGNTLLARVMIEANLRHFGDSMDPAQWARSGCALAKLYSETGSTMRALAALECTSATVCASASAHAVYLHRASVTLFDEALVRGDTRLAHELLHALSARAASSVAELADARADTLLCRARYLHAVGRDAECESVLVACERDCEFRRDEQKLAETLLERARLYARVGRTDMALRVVLQGVSICERRTFVSQLARMSVVLASVFLHWNKLDQVEQLVAQHLRHLRTHCAPCDVADALVILAQCAVLRGDARVSIRLLDDAREYYERVNCGAGITTVWHWLAIAHDACDEHAKRDDAARNFLAQRAAWTGDKHDQDARSIASFGTSWSTRLRRRWANARDDNKNASDKSE